MKNQYSLDGVPLQDPALRWFTDKETGIRIVPARRIAEQRFPGVDGMNFIPGAPYDEGAVEVNFQVQGSDYADFRKNLEFLSALVGQRHRPIVMRDHYDANAANDRVAGVTLAASAEPRMLSAKSALMQVLFSVPGTFWRSAAPVVTTGVKITSAVQTLTLDQLAGGNAPIDDMLIRIRGGAFGSMYIEDPISGSRLNINTPLLATETLIIDPKNWNAIIVADVTTDTWSLNQGRNVSGLIVPNRGMGSMFMVEPELVAATTSFAYRVRIAGTNVTGTPTVVVRALRSYL